MLPERYQEMLTAFVDGELSRRQRKVVLRLLHRFSEARAFLRQLQEDAHRLRTLPPVKLGVDLAPAIVQAIQERELQPHCQPAVIRRPFKAWRRWAMAAAVLLAVGAGIFFFLPRHGEQPTGPSHLVKQPPTPKKGPSDGPAGDSLVALVTEGAFYRFAEPFPAKVDKGFRLALTELNQENSQKSLAKELQKETSFHLDVTVADSGKAIEKLRGSFRQKGIAVLVDKSATTAMAKERAEILVYAENVKPEDLTQVLRELGAGEAKVQATPATEEKGTALVVAALTKEHRQDLSKLLGVDAAHLQPPRRGPAPFFDPPLIAAGPKDGPKEGKKRPTPNVVPPPSPPEPIALVLANRPGSGGLSPEIKAFLAHRNRNLRPGTLQVLLVVHQARA